jgi:hypothetical protein
MEPFVLPQSTIAQWSWVGLGMLQIQELSNTWCLWEYFKLFELNSNKFIEIWIQFNFDLTIEFKFIWKQMGCKLVEKVLKIWDNKSLSYRE